MIVRLVTHTNIIVHPEIRKITVQKMENVKENNDARTNGLWQNRNRRRTARHEFDRRTGSVACSPLPDAPAAIEAALQAPIGTRPLAQLAQGRSNACIVICDITRPVPNKSLLPPILRTLEQAGIGRENITILIATGTHRPNEGAELDALIGADIARQYRDCQSRLQRLGLASISWACLPTAFRSGWTKPTARPT